MAILSGGTDLYNIFAVIGTVIGGSGTNNTVPLWNGATALDNSILTENAGVMTCTGDLNTTGGIRFSTEQSSTFVMKQLEIGDWNMDTTFTVNVAHGLSSSEWKTITGIDIQIRNNAASLLSSLYMLDSVTQTPAGFVDKFNATNIDLDAPSGGPFDNTNYNATSFNRGWVTFWYIKD